jgi:hypothetical protein
MVLMRLVLGGKEAAVATNRVKESVMNRRNPCRRCHLGTKDKNNRQCRVCAKRLAYLRKLTIDLEFSAAVVVDHGYPVHLPSKWI